MNEITYFALLLLVMGMVIFAKLYFDLRKRLGETLSSKQSLSVRYGKMTEQFFPFMESYPYDSQRFRFIGSPIDGVQFNDDGIVFVEFKSAGAKLSHEQARIKELVESKKVGFREVRMDK